MLPLVTSPRFIEVHRLGVFPDRSLDIDVVFDLMIHDLDVILALVRSDVDVDRGGRRAGADRRSSTSRTRGCASRPGCIANVTASRISRERVRKIRFFQPDAYISIDYAAQEVEGWRLVRRDGAAARRSRAGRCRSSATSRCERELADFVRAVARTATPLVDGEAGRRALELATRDRGEDGDV